MRPGDVTAFRLLSLEALRDAARRRIVPVIVAVSVLSLLVVDSCTSCGSADVTANGQPVDVTDIAGWTGMVIYTVLALWCTVLAGVLGSDHLAETLADGSANLTLARPVRRETFALGRLGGALAIAWVTGAVLLGVTAVLLQARHGSALGPAVLAGLAFALSALVVGAFSMAASLALPRTATALLVLRLVGAVGVANALSLGGAELGGLLGVIDRLGPPFASAVVVALAPWVAPVEVAGDPLALMLRLVVWAGFAVATLLLAFRRVELGR